MLGTGDKDILKEVFVSEGSIATWQSKAIQK
jgi:hypothetical protein